MFTPFKNAARAPGTKSPLRVPVIAFTPEWVAKQPAPIQEAAAAEEYPSRYPHLVFSQPLPVPNRAGIMERGRRPREIKLQKPNRQIEKIWID